MSTNVLLGKPDGEMMRRGIVHAGFSVFSSSVADDLFFWDDTPCHFQEERILRTILVHIY
jgi:hypothetical protein